jgi:two-component system NtrC family sensor kinase
MKKLSLDSRLTNARIGARQLPNTDVDVEPTKARLLAILEATIDLVAMTNLKNQRMFYLNEAGRKMLGIETTEDISSLRITDFQPEWAIELVQSEGVPTALEKGVWVGETGFVTRSGLEISVSQLILAHQAPDGSSAYLSTIARDITEGKRALEALRRSEELFRIMTENAKELIALVDTRGKRIYNSPSYQAVLGYSPEELQGTWSLEQTHPEDREKVIAAAQETKATGVGKFIEYRMRHKDGSYRTLESHAGVIRNAQGEIENILIVARDITERKRAERERELMEIQLRHAQKMESIGQLAAGIAHEINTPTQYIGDNTRFLKDAFTDLHQLLGHYDKLLEAAKSNAITPELLNQVDAAAKRADLSYLVSEIPKAIDQSLEGVERVAKIVCAMKDFSHPGAEDKVVVNLNKAIESTLTMTHNEWKFVAEVVMDFDQNLPAIPCFPGQLNQVLLNLIVNAAHAIGDRVGDGSQSKGTITVQTRHRDDFVEIRITDTGVGIPERVRSRIFEPFFTTKPIGKGTGQGLAIAHAVIVDQHGGTIDFETEIGVGTTFIIRLPLLPA